MPEGDSPEKMIPTLRSWGRFLLVPMTVAYGKSLYHPMPRIIGSRSLNLLTFALSSPACRPGVLAVPTQRVEERPLREAEGDAQKGGSW